MDETKGLTNGVIQIWSESDEYAWLEFYGEGTITWEVWLDGGNTILDYGIGDGEDDTMILTGTFAGGIFTVSVPG